MAGGDYRRCDKCGHKAFYDAELNYQHCRGEQTNGGVREAGKEACYKLGYLGDWAVLCDECSKTFECVIVARDSAIERAEQ